MFYNVSTDSPEDSQQDDGPDAGGNDRPKQTTAGVNAQNAEQPTAEESPNDADDDIGEHSAAGAAYYFAADPARDEADEEEYQKFGECHDKKI